MLQRTTTRSESHLASMMQRQHRLALRALATLILLVGSLGCSHSAADEDEGGCGGTCEGESDCEGATTCVETTRGSRCLPSACRGCDRVCQYSEEVIGSTSFCNFDGCE